MELSAGLHAFRLAAAERGAYATQHLAARRLLDAIKQPPRPSPRPCAHDHAVRGAIVLLDVELRRLICNVSCRIGKRHPSLRAIREDLRAVYNENRKYARAWHIELEDKSLSQKTPMPLEEKGDSDTLKEGLISTPRKGDLELASSSSASSDCLLLATHGCRHLCERGCYFKAYEPARKQRARAKPTSNSRFFPPVGSKRIREDLSSQISPTTPPGNDHRSTSAAPSPIEPWRAPRSPYGLLEELFWDRPWALLLCCILLNQTTRAQALSQWFVRVQVDPVLARLLARFPDAAALAAAGCSPTARAEIIDILRPLGLHRRRAERVINFSREFLRGEWTRPEELPGVGKYGADAYWVFCRGETVTPNDHALNWYCEWLTDTATSSVHVLRTHSEGSATHIPDLAGHLALQSHSHDIEQLTEAAT